MDKRERLSEILKVIPPPMSQDEITDSLDLIHKEEQKLANHYIGSKEVTVGVYNDEVSIFLPLSDIHLGTKATDMKAVYEEINFIMETDGAYAMITGDFIEYMTTKYLKTNVLQLTMTPQQMIEYAREIMRPLAESGKLLMDTSNYFGHEGWDEKLDIWRLIVGDLPVNHIRNGGVLKVEFPNEYEETFKVYHYPQKHSGNDPIHGLRQEALKYSAKLRHKGFISGHFHQMGIAKENYPGQKESTYYIICGTTKGSNPELPPDELGAYIGGVDYTDPLGQGVVIRPGNQHSPAVEYVFPTLEHGRTILKSVQILERAPRTNLLLQALDIAESTSSQNITDEMVQKIRAEVEVKPQIRFLKSASEKLTHSPFADQFKDQSLQEGEEPTKYPEVYNRVKIEVVSKFPIAFHPLSNDRLGSNSEGARLFKGYLDEFIAGNPHSVYTLMGNIIDRDLHGRSNRLSQLDRAIKLFLPTQEQLLAILADNGLLHSGWKNTVGSELDQRAITPSNYLSENLKTPIVHSESLLEIGIRQPGDRDRLTYSSLLLGGTAGQNMKMRPTTGLISYYYNWGGDKPGSVIGGTNESSGVATIHDWHNAETEYPNFLAPGWFAHSTNTRKKNNVSFGAQPGQALIYLPDRYMTFPTGNITETRDIYNALFLLYGLNYLGLTDQVLG